MAGSAEPRAVQKRGVGCFESVFAASENSAHNSFPQTESPKPEARRPKPYNERPCNWTVILMLLPDFKEFSRLAREATLVPVVKSVSADLLTPVSAFLAISQKQSHAFLLESIERGEQIGRYTFLGAGPYMRVKASRGKIEIADARKSPTVNAAKDPAFRMGHPRDPRAKDNVFQVVKRLLREHRAAHIQGLPPFTAGAVGYFAYDVVRQLEKIGDRAKDDLSVPDAELMFFDRLLAFDHLRHQIHIMAAADVSRESPRHAYDRAVRDIGALEKKLASGLG